MVIRADLFCRTGFPSASMGFPSAISVVAKSKLEDARSAINNHFIVVPPSNKKTETGDFKAHKNPIRSVIR